MSSTPTDIATFLERQLVAWDAGEHDAFVQLHRDIAPAGFSVEIPVGAGPQQGWGALEKLWDDHHGRSALSFDTVIVPTGGEAAVLERITVQHEGREIVRHSIHTYDFRGDRMAVRYYVPATKPSGKEAPDRLRAFLLDQVAAWNAGDREECLRQYEAISGGRYFLEFPLGADEVPGRPVIEQIWDKLQTITRLTIDHVAVSDDGTEAALYVRNLHTHEDGSTDTNVSIEIYRLDDDGLHIRYFSEADSV
jgi:hypothetical protein